MNNNYIHKTHRISAQKSLQMPDSISPKSIEAAGNDLLYGSDTDISDKKWSRYTNSTPAIKMISDFDKLMIYLFSDAVEISNNYFIESQNSTSKVEPPYRKLDKLKQIWEKILPHRELKIGGMDIKTKVKNSTSEYKSSEMSDGERVIFYLIGQCLSAPKDGIIIIDEPELHLHKSVQILLWLEIEKLRSDCLFIYLTHDINFAASKINASKIWVKSYDGENWGFEVIKNDQELPEELLLEILGNRRDVVFVEGTNDSHDSQLYRAILKDFLVIPVGSCTQVIQNVKSFKSNDQLHHLKIYGVIDRDRRTSHEVTQLQNDNIYTLNLAEVENFFCTKEVVEFTATLLKDNVKYEAVKYAIFSQLKSELEGQISLHTMSEIKFQLSLLSDKSKGIESILQDVATHVKTIQVEDIYNAIKAIFDEIIDKQDYEKLLQFYNRKKLYHHVSNQYGIEAKKFPDMVIRQVSNNKDFANSLIKYFGNFEQKINPNEHN